MFKCKYFIASLVLLSNSGLLQPSSFSLLCYAMLCYPILYYAILCYATVRYGAVRCIALHCTALYCAMMYRAVPCRIVPYRTVPYRTIPYHTILNYRSIFTTVIGSCISAITIQVTVSDYSPLFAEDIAFFLSMVIHAFFFFKLLEVPNSNQQQAATWLQMRCTNNWNYKCYVISMLNNIFKWLTNTSYNTFYVKKTLYYLTR